MVVNWTDDATKHLKDIFTYYREVASFRVANRIRNEIKSTGNMLGNFPYMGISEDIDDNNYAIDYRSILANRYYKIIYHIDDDSVFIVAVWDVRQDPSKMALTIQRP